MKENKTKPAAAYFVKLFILYAIFVSLLNAYIPTNFPRHSGDDMIDFLKILASVACSITLIFFYDKYRNDNQKEEEEEKDSPPPRTRRTTKKRK